MEPKTQAASLPKPLWPPNSRPPSSPFPRVLCGDECNPKPWENHDPIRKGLHSSPLVTGSPPSKYLSLLVPVKPRALLPGAGGETEATTEPLLQ